jgi:hypothetical protein
MFPKFIFGIITFTNLGGLLHGSPFIRSAY